MTLELQVLAWDEPKAVEGFNGLWDCNPLLIVGSTTPIVINKQ
jgi:hypothetical protein